MRRLSGDDKAIGWHCPTPGFMFSTTNETRTHPHRDAARDTRADRLRRIRGVAQASREEGGPNAPSFKLKSIHLELGVQVTKSTSAGVQLRLLTASQQKQHASRHTIALDFEPEWVDVDPKTKKKRRGSKKMKKR